MSYSNREFDRWIKRYGLENLIRSKVGDEGTPD